MTEVACWAHARRKFYKGNRLVPDDDLARMREVEAQMPQLTESIEKDERIRVAGGRTILGRPKTIERWCELWRSFCIR